ncbi:ABC transporter transmembrane domain-containing protein [Escherichia coli]
MGQVATSAEQMLKGHKEVLIFGGQEVETKRFDKVSNRMRLQGMKMVSASSISDPIIQLIASWRWRLFCMRRASQVPWIA